MATSGSGLISQGLQDLFDASKDLQCQNLKNQWTKDIEDSNRVIENIQTIENYISTHSKEIEDQINVLISPVFSSRTISTSFSVVFFAI